jgi:hypothetical protein
MRSVVGLFVFWGGFVRTLLGVEAGVGEAQPRYGATVEEMFCDDLLNVVDVDEAVPDGLGIDHDDGAVLALIEASGFVGADVMLEASVFDGVLEGRFELFAAVGEAAGAGGRFVALVGADEDVVVKLWQESGSLPERRVCGTQGFLRQ